MGNRNEGRSATDSSRWKWQLVASTFCMHLKQIWDAKKSSYPWTDMENGIFVASRGSGGCSVVQAEMEDRRLSAMRWTPTHHSRRGEIVYLRTGGYSIRTSTSHQRSALSMNLLISSRKPRILQSAAKVQKRAPRWMQPWWSSPGRLITTA